MASRRCYYGFDGRSWAFATIVGLLSNFKSQRSSGDLNDFILWLKQEQHADIAASVQNNELLLQQLSSILSVNHDDLINRLIELDMLMSSVAGQMKEFSGLAGVLYPQLNISPQAVSIIQQLVSSGAKMFMERKFMTGNLNQYILLEGGVGTITYNEARFIEDDLDTLVKIGLLRMDVASKGSRRFHITRSAVDFVKIVDH